MNSFMSVHQDKIIGNLTMFDRMIFKGHLTMFYPKGAFNRFLNTQGVLLKNFKSYVPTITLIVKTHAQQVARELGRPFIYLEKATTKASGQSKEDLARSIAARDGITEGLICVLSVLEPCSSFGVRGNPQTHRLEVVRANRRCLHFYFYFIDPEFGFMHVKLQSWFPFRIQLYINGREWLAKQLDKRGVGYRRYENSFTEIENMAIAQELCEHFAHRKWPRVLNGFARKVNPLLSLIKQSGFGGYYWVLDQGEIATDIMFGDRKTLQAIMPDLFDHALKEFSAEDVMKFLGRKLHGNFLGEVITDQKKRPEGRRVKHRMKRNSIKIYDKWSVLRIETTINNPREFKVLRVVETRGRTKRRWMPMGKSVANLWRFSQIGKQANHRYLEALAQVTLKGEAVKELDSLCRSVVKDGKRHGKFNPLTKRDIVLFRIVLFGEHVINGFRNSDICKQLYARLGSDPFERKRKCARVSRMIAKLRGHGLICKVKNSYLYRVTRRGYRTISACLDFYQDSFPYAYMQRA